jgi:hypothetical protein
MHHKQPFHHHRCAGARWVVRVFFRVRAVSFFQDIAVARRDVTVDR